MYHCTVGLTRLHSFRDIPVDLDVAQEKNRKNLDHEKIETAMRDIDWAKARQNSQTQTQIAQHESEWSSQFSSVQFIYLMT